MPSDTGIVFRRLLAYSAVSDFETGRNQFIDKHMVVLVSELVSLFQKTNIVINNENPSARAFFFRF